LSELALSQITAWQLIIGAWALVVAVSDWRQRRIPNTLLVAAAVGAVLGLLVHGRSLLGASGSSVALGVALGLLLTVPGYLMRALGAGDVTGYLMRALGAGDVKLLFVIALLGGAWVALGSLAIGALLCAVFGLMGVAMCRLRGEKPPEGRYLPLGSAMLVGLLIMMFSGEAPPQWP
jgi:prepilin peptidase CpaA